MIAWLRRIFCGGPTVVYVHVKECPALIRQQPLQPGEPVVIHNYHVGEFLESWNGALGTFEYEDENFCWIKFSERTCALGFPRECVLPLDSGYACAKENMLGSLEWVRRRMFDADYERTADVPCVRDDRQGDPQAETAGGTTRDGGQGLQVR